MKVQLLTVTDSPNEFISDPQWCAQEKLNGERMIIEKRGITVRAFNRRGEERAIPAATLALAMTSGKDWLIDGELIRDNFTAFDLIEEGWMIGRFMNLEDVSPFPVVRTSFYERAKRDLLEAIENEKGEGVVFKKLNEPYRDGRDVNAVKFKFWNSESFVVAHVNIAAGTVALQRDGKECGKCQFPFAGIWPKVGDVVEIRFQSRGKTGKCIHPSMLGVRTDIQACEIA